MNQADELCFFWDLQNCPVPSKGSPYECVTAIRAAVLKGERTKEVNFNAYCNVSTLSQETRQELGRARVIVRDVPSQKPAASDIRLLQDILHHTMTHRSGIIVLISGDIDFAETVHDLVHTGGYKVILIHNRQARPELRKNASKALSFEDVVGVAGTAKGDSRKDDRRTISNEGNKKGDKSNEKMIDKRPTKDGDKKLAKKPPPKKVVARQHHQVEQWKCVGCAKSFQSEKARDSHVAATGHIVEWDCSECGKLFKSEVGLEQHKDATGHGQIACEECGKQFNNMKSLAQHLRATKHCDELCWCCPLCKEEWDDLLELLDHVRLDHD
jgi:DNA-directed RNA polymerase subunit RPC12/RpoP